MADRWIRLGAAAAAVGGILGLILAALAVLTTVPRECTPGPAIGHEKGPQSS